MRHRKDELPLLGHKFQKSLLFFSTFFTSFQWFYSSTSNWLSFCLVTNLTQFRVLLRSLWLPSGKHICTGHVLSINLDLWFPLWWNTSSSKNQISELCFVSFLSVSRCFCLFVDPPTPKTIPFLVSQFSNNKNGSLIIGQIWNFWCWEKLFYITQKYEHMNILFFPQPFAPSRLSSLC